MKTKDLPEITSVLCEKLKADDYSDTVLDNTRWILGHFGNYCNRKGIPEVIVAIAVAFMQECFGFDYYNLTARMQSVLRRLLMILIELEESGNYLKTHQRTKGGNLTSANKFSYPSGRGWNIYRNLQKPIPIMRYTRRSMKQAGH